MPAFNSINISYIFEQIYEFFTGKLTFSFTAAASLFSAFLSLIKPVSVLVSLIFLTGIVYCLIRTRQLVHEAEEKSHAGGAHGEAHGAGETHGPSSGSHAGSAVNKRWQKITDHINSTNPSDWRLAILECDIILDEMLTKMSYHGETLSDKLKAVEKSDFLSIDKAWEAHRVRNAIAHEGSNFEISEREARHVVTLYEDVFKEFHFI